MKAHSINTQHTTLGALLLVSAMACFSLSDATAKQLAAVLSPVQTAWFRFALLALTVVPLALRRPALWRSQRPLLQILRALALVGSAVLFLTGLQRMPIAEATAMVFASPLFVTLLAMLLLGEAMSAPRWVPVMVGFAGVLIVLRPGHFAFGGAEMYPLLSSMAWAVAVISTRLLGARDPIATTMLYSALIGLAGLTPLALPVGDALSLVPATHEWPLLFAMMLAWCGAQWLIVAAYRVALPSAVAPFSYSQLIWSGLLGVVLFDHVPDGMGLLGIAVIFFAGLLALWQTRAGRASPRGAATPHPEGLA